MTDPYRALCAELLTALEIQLDELRFNNRLCIRARALLDQPEPEVPTDEALLSVFWEHENGLEELWAADWPAAARAVLARWGNSTPLLEPEVPTDGELWALGNDDFRANYYPTDAIYYARAVLARWGNPTPQPVSVSERLPGPEDCDAEGNCWWFDNDDYKWCLESPYMGTRLLCWTHWLPANSLPTPETTND